MWFMHLSLLGGWLPVTVAAAAWAALVLGVGWWTRALWHWIVLAGMVAMVVVLTAAAADVPSRVGSTYPRSFLVWAALPLFALGAAIWQWRKVSWWRRSVAFLAVPGLAAFGALQVNAHYGYLPTVGDLLGAPLVGEVNAKQLEIRPHVRLAGRHRTPALQVLPRYGEVARVDIPASASHFAHRQAYVWLPPIYFADQRPRLPVLMLISGTPGTTDDWLRGGRALGLANAWATAHHGYAPVMVLPDANGSGTGDTECVNSARGQAETYLTVDVPRFMTTRFGVSGRAARWAVAGLSEGGTCALELVSRHPDLFHSFGDFSGDPAPTLGQSSRTLRVLFDGSVSARRAHDPTRWFATDVAAGVEGFLAVGSGDRTYLSDEREIMDVARRYRMRVRLDVIPGGGHNFYTWAHALADAYPWFVQRLRIPDPTTPVVASQGDASSARWHSVRA
jgi:S-formylglutathione hydrolase FrmB